MKCPLLFLALLLGCLLSPAPAKTAQSIINELRAEAQKGKAYTATLEANIKDLDEYAVVQWRRAEREKAEREELVAKVQKLEAKDRHVFTFGFLIGLSLAGLGLIFARRQKAPPVPAPKPNPEPDRSMPTHAAGRRRKPASRKK